MKKAILVTEMPKKCIDCPLVYKEDHFIYRCKVSEDQVDPNGIYRDCPLKSYKDSIPIEWIREYICDLEVVISSMRKSHFPNEQAIYNQQFRVFQIKSLLEDWEKENEKDI